MRHEWMASAFAAWHARTHKKYPQTVSHRAVQRCMSTYCIQCCNCLAQCAHISASFMAPTQHTMGEKSFRVCYYYYCVVNCGRGMELITQGCNVCNVQRKGEFFQLALGFMLRVSAKGRSAVKASLRVASQCCP